MIHLHASNVKPKESKVGYHRIVVKDIQSTDGLGLNPNSTVS